MTIIDPLPEKSPVTDPKTGRMSLDWQRWFRQFVATVDPASIGSISVSGGVTLGYAAKTAAYTLTATDYTVNCTSGTFALTLPTAVDVTGQVYNLKNSGTGVITINTTSAQKIDGSASGALTLAQYDRMTVQSNGANWMIL